MPIVAKQTVETEKEQLLHRIRHSTAHLMAEAVQALFPGTHLGFGPAIADGFYYDFDTEHRFTEEDLKAIELKMREISKQGAAFERMEIGKAEALALFAGQDEKLKAEHVETLTDGTITLYQSGAFTDLCAGPHVATTRDLGHFKLTAVSGAYWRGDENREQLQRIYGTAWETRDELKEHLRRLEEAKKRDHRVLGKQLDLFAFPELAGPGLPFYLPKGARIVEEMKRWIWGLHVNGTYGHPDKPYEPLLTPHILKTDAWHTSGHIQNYRENMFMVYSLDELDQGMLAEGGKGEGLGNYGLKPMNCPGHVMLFNVGTKSYRDLPVRYFEFGTVYRYERAGTLHGMLRVRSFTQDDAHIFCTPETYHAEVLGVFDFCCHVLETFGFEYMVGLKTRGEKRIGSDEIWDLAEDGLRKALEKRAAGKYYVQEGDATFYGPKIDFVIKDSLGREWQGGTIQLDFNLPERFDLTYVDADGERKRPVMIHRAIQGSFERFFGLLIEEFGGAFPTWLAPVQVRVLPIAQDHHAYARRVAAELRGLGYRVELDDGNDTLNKKIRAGKTAKIPYLVVLGGQEAEAGTITVEGYHDGKLRHLTTVKALAGHLQAEIDAKVARRKA
ncbi:MAG: threonine--tRNA ligase [Pseudomonadota bacterium]